MRRILFTAALATFAAGTAAADVPPPPVENPLGEACTPFIGVWHRVEPRVTRGGSDWWIVAIDSERAVLIDYSNQSNVNIKADAMPFALTCTANADGTVTLDFTGDGKMKVALTVKPVDETTFTTTEESSYLNAGPPDPDWKPEQLTITWKRIAK